jgi:circadian clock protein KaiB
VSTDSRSDMERPPDAEPEIWQFRLYIVAGARNSILALSHLRAILDERVPNCYELEVVDILQEPQRPFTDGILLTPTLLKLAPLPVARVVGNLSESAQVIWALDLPPPSHVATGV